MSDCIFCKILRGEIPCYKVYEDDKVLAFLDIHPATRGHTLVVPKKHYIDINDFPENEFGEFMKSVQTVAKGIIQYKEGLNILQSNRKAAGQDVFHIHFHLIPRASGDGVKVGDWDSLEIKDFENVQEEIKKLLK